MRQSGCWLSISFLLCLRGDPLVVGCKSYRQNGGRLVTKSELSYLDTDFENGSLGPWIEESQTSGVQWKIENKISPWDLNNKAPSQLNGNNYLRVDRGKNFKFGVAVLRSPVFSVPSSDNISFSFSFWIRSKWPQFTNLELYLTENGNERLLLNLNNYSIITNQAWESRSIPLISPSSSTISLVFYAYCGIDTEDAVAIDDIRFVSNQFTGTETTPYKPTASTEVSNPEDISESTSPTNFSSITTSSTTPSVEVTTKSTIATITSTESTAMTTTIPTTSTKPSEPTTTPTISTSTATTTTKVPTTTISTSFTCPDTSAKKYPDPENPCNGKYYQCFEGIATLMNCQENLIFNINAQLCTPCSLVPACADECSENNLLFSFISNS